MLLTKELQGSIEDAVQNPGEFCIKLTEVWVEVGYSTKQKCEQALGRFLEKDVDYVLPSQLDLNLVVKNPSGGRTANEIFLTGDGFKHLCLSANTPEGREIRRYYIEVEKQYRKILEASLRSSQPSSESLPTISPRIYAALKYEKDSYRPWRKANPESDPYFRKLVAIPAQPIEQSESQALQPQDGLAPLDDEYFVKERKIVLETLEAVSLAAHRASLVGNKSINEAEFLAKQLDKLREVFEEQEAKTGRLNEALKDSETQIERLQKDLKIANAATESTKAKADGYEAVYRSHKMEISQLKSKIQDLEMQLRLQNTALNLSSGNGNSFLGLPPAV